jgi:hypothetical protein
MWTSFGYPTEFCRYHGPVGMSHEVQVGFCLHIGHWFVQRLGPLTLGPDGVLLPHSSSSMLSSDNEVAL